VATTLLYSTHLTHCSCQEIETPLKFLLTVIYCSHFLGLGLCSGMQLEYLTCSWTLFCHPWLIVVCSDSYV